MSAEDENTAVLQGDADAGEAEVAPEATDGDATAVETEAVEAAEEEKEALDAPEELQVTTGAAVEGDTQLSPLASPIAADEPESEAESPDQEQASTVDVPPSNLMETALAPVDADLTQLASSPAQSPIAVAPESPAAQAVELPDPKIDIKFVVAPEGFVHLMHVPVSVKIQYLYDKLSDTFRCNRRHLKILYRGTLLMDEDVLSDKINVVIDGHLLLNVELEIMPRHLHQLQKYEVLDSVVGIHVKLGEGVPAKAITVAVVRGFQHKQYMGGYRNKKSATEYHHAVAQTDARKKEPKPRPPQYTRDTQTAGISRSMQTKREAFTQMPRPGLELDTSEERLYTSKPYFSAKDLHVLRVAKCIVLQAVVRGWRARRLARSLRDEEEGRQAAIQAEEARLQKAQDAAKQREIERRTHPRTAADFAVLYNELEAWRLQEAQKIAESDMSEGEKFLARQELLKKETRLLQTIDKLQIKANAENKKEKIAKELAEMAAHKVWKHKNPELGTTIVETPFTVRSKELLDLYNGMQLKGLSVDERLDILLHVKWSVKEFECALTREIVELIDREADLLNRGRKEKSLEGLRQRMSNLFLQFCETPEFNPEAINHQRVPLEFTTRPLVKLDGKR